MAQPRYKKSGKLKRNVSNSDCFRTATTRDLRKILNYLSLNSPSYLTEIKNETGMDIYKIKDGLLFLRGLDIIQINKKASKSMNYYFLKEGKYVSEKK